MTIQTCPKCVLGLVPNDPFSDGPSVRTCPECQGAGKVEAPDPEPDASWINWDMVPSADWSVPVEAC